jgi:hypothetical protein
VPLVDAVAHGLADEVSTERPDAETVLLEELALPAGVAAVGDRLVDLEVVAPAGELEPIEAPARTARGELRDRQVGPLAGEQGDGTRHRISLLVSDRDGQREPGGAELGGCGLVP